MKYFIGILISGILFIAGFLLGRKTIEQTESIKYTRAPEYKVNFRINTPVSETFLPDSFKLSDIEVPAGFNLPDTIDLLPTAYDWNIERKYSDVLFDNMYGKFEFEAVVQYNKLQSITPSFKPIQVEKTIYREKVWQPFILGSAGSLNTVGVGGGTFYHDIGVGVRYVYDYKRKEKGFDLSVLYKF